MSTLAAARADNFYYPPEWDPSKGGLNKVRLSWGNKEQAMGSSLHTLHLLPIALTAGEHD